MKVYVCACVSTIFEVWLWDSVGDSIAVFAHVCECQHSRMCVQDIRGHRKAACLNSIPLHTPEGTFTTAILFYIYSINSVALQFFSFWQNIIMLLFRGQTLILTAWLAEGHTSGTGGTS